MRFVNNYFSILSLFSFVKLQQKHARHLCIVTNQLAPANWDLYRFSVVKYPPTADSVHPGWVLVFDIFVSIETPGPANKYPRNEFSNP